MVDLNQIKAKLSYGTLFVLSILLWGSLGSIGMLQEWYNQAWEWLLILGTGYLLFTK